MGERQIPAELPIGKALAEGETGAGRGKRLEAEALQIARAAHVPRVGNDETAGLVKLAEGAAFLGDGGHDCLSLFSPLLANDIACGMYVTLFRKKT